jgi:hypothetical protein
LNIGTFPEVAGGDRIAPNLQTDSAVSLGGDLSPGLERGQGRDGRQTIVHYGTIACDVEGAIGTGRATADPELVAGLAGAIPEDRRIR